MLTRLLKSPFVRHILVLTSGSALAQGISILVQPVLTRLYTPADYGVFALFMAIISSLAPAICGRFELAIVVAKDDDDAKQLLALSVLVAISVSFATLIILFLFWNPLIVLLNASSLGLWLVVIPLVLFLNGVIAALSYYSNRIQAYGTISTATLLQTIVGVTGSILFGILSMSADGLLLGALCGLVFTSLWLIVKYRKTINRQMLAWGQRKKRILKDYRDFPIYNASTGLLDGFQVAMPVFFLFRFFPDVAVGYYALILRIVQAPLGFLSSAISQVHLKRVSDLVNQNVPVRPYLKRLTLILAVGVAPFVTVLIVAAPDLFVLAFGENWRPAGTYAQILVPAVALRFIVSTVSTTLAGTRNNRLGATWKIMAFIVTGGMFLILAPRLAILEMFMAILFTDIAMYLFYFLLIWKAAGHPRS